MRETKNGRELVEYALRVFRDPDDEFMHHHRWEALQWLADRGLGRPIEMVALDAALAIPEANPKPAKLDVALLDQRQRDSLRAALALLRGDRSALLPAPVIDVETTNDDEDADDEAATE